MQRLEVIERMVDLLLKNSNIDFSKEDAAVLKLTEQVKTETEKIPNPPEPITTN